MGSLDFWEVVAADFVGDRLGVADDSCRVADGYAACWHVARDYGARPNHYPVTQFDPREDDGGCANPAVASDPDGSSGLPHGAVGHVMVC
jgi:hypothetical protein